MTDILSVKEVRLRGALIGYELTVYPSEEKVLVWANQSKMPGFRAVKGGSSFVPSLNEMLEKREVLTLQADYSSAQAQPALTRGQVWRNAEGDYYITAKWGEVGIALVNLVTGLTREFTYVGKSCDFLSVKK